MHLSQSRNFFAKPAFDGVSYFKLIIMDKI